MVDTEARKKLLRTLESDIDVWGWDQPPRVYAVAIDETGEEFLEKITEIDGHPGEFFRMISIAYGGLLKQVVGFGRIVGFALSTEGWTYPVEALPPKDTSMEEIERMWRECPPSQHPDRRELRQVTMVTTDGWVGSVTRMRGEEPETLGEEAGLSGMVVDAMRAALGMEPVSNE